MGWAGGLGIVDRAGAAGRVVGSASGLASGAFECPGRQSQTLATGSVLSNSQYLSMTLFCVASFGWMPSGMYMSRVQDASQMYGPQHSHGSVRLASPLSSNS